MAQKGEISVEKALFGLHNKSEHLSKVVEYFDQAFKVVAGDDTLIQNGGDGGGIMDDDLTKSATDKLVDQVKLYVMDALDTVAKDMDDISNKLMEDVESSASRVNDMTVQLELLKSHIDLGKNYFMMQKFAAISRGKPTAETAGDKAKRRTEKEIQEMIPYFAASTHHALQQEDYHRMDALRKVSKIKNQFMALGSPLFRAKEGGVVFADTSRQPKEPPVIKDENTAPRKTKKEAFKPKRRRSSTSTQSSVMNPRAGASTLKPFGGQ